MKNGKNGITLIALVITIIVLLVLAGITLNIVFDGGIIEKSEESIDTCEEESVKEKLMLALTEFKFRELSKEDVQLANFLESLGTIQEDGDYYEVEVDGYKFKVDKQTLEVVKLGVTSNEIIGNKATLGIIVTGKNATINGGAFACYNPVIPVGFKAINTDTAKWEDNNKDGKIDGWNAGLVIEDGNKNQFVWVPAYIEEEISGVTEYNRRYLCTDGRTSGCSDAEIPTQIVNGWKQTETTQIEKYGGFYIARYEAGIPTDDDNLTKGLTTASKSARNKEGKPLSRENEIPWNYIDYNTSKANAESMYSTENVQSGLVTGKMWDTVMQWYVDAEIDIDVVNNSHDCGNYYGADVTNVTQYSIDDGESWKKITSKDKGISTGWLLKTGNSEYTNRNNIYDMAGNLWEWTGEKYSSNFVYRGGGYDKYGEYPASVRFGDKKASSCAYDVGFRVALYVRW